MSDEIAPSVEVENIAKQNEQTLEPVATVTEESKIVSKTFVAPNKRKQEILEYLKIHGSATIEEIMEYTGNNRAASTFVLKYHTKNGLLKAVEIPGVRTKRYMLASVVTPKIIAPSSKKVAAKPDVMSLTADNFASPVDFEIYKTARSMKRMVTATTICKKMGRKDIYFYVTRMIKQGFFSTTLRKDLPGGPVLLTPTVPKKNLHPKLKRRGRPLKVEQAEFTSKQLYSKCHAEEKIQVTPKAISAPVKNVHLPVIEQKPDEIVEVLESLPDLPWREVNVKWDNVLIYEKLWRFVVQRKLDGNVKYFLVSWADKETDDAMLALHKMADNAVQSVIPEAYRYIPKWKKRRQIAEMTTDTCAMKDTIVESAGRN